MPESQNLDNCEVFSEAVAEVIANSPQVQAPDAGKILVECRRTNQRLSLKETERSLDLFAECHRRFGAMSCPPS